MVSCSYLSLPFHISVSRGTTYPILSGRHTCSEVHILFFPSAVFSCINLLRFDSPLLLCWWCPELINVGYKTGFLKVGLHITCITHTHTLLSYWVSHLHMFVTELAGSVLEGGEFQILSGKHGRAEQVKLLLKLTPLYMKSCGSIHLHLDSFLTTYWIILSIAFVANSLVFVQFAFMVNVLVGLQLDLQRTCRVLMLLDLVYQQQNCLCSPAVIN